MEVIITCNIPQKNIVNVKEYWGISDEDWSKLLHYEKKQLIEGWIRNKMDVRWKEKE